MEMEAQMMADLMAAEKARKMKETEIAERQANALERIADILGRVQDELAALRTKNAGD